MARLFDDGASQYLMQTSGSPVSGYPLTMSCWFRTDDVTASQALFWIGDKDVANHLFELMMNGADPGDPIWLWATGGGAPSIASTSTGASVNTWHHACGVFASATDRAVFIDGGSKGTAVANVTPAGLDATAIGSERGAFWYMSGSVSGAAVWGAALSDLEVLLLAQGVPSMLIRPGDLKSFWPLIDNDQDVLERGFHMSRFNAPTWRAHPRKILDQYAKWENRAGIRVPYRGRLAGRFNVPWSVRAGITAVPRIPRPTAAYNNLAIY